uniref:Uncharacterized protein n=1 Tax=Oryza sativa subsp. japonica TaxID=39947 RepID=Q69RU1_ORYSJ|nr:hypothetical protein [Oryza sativa Japonica Group]BAD30986.1 hypothetical protein [Oryza sativa Japonica Group]
MALAKHIAGADAPVVVVVHDRASDLALALASWTRTVKPPGAFPCHIDRNNLFELAISTVLEKPTGVQQ